MIKSKKIVFSLLEILETINFLNENKIQIRLPLFYNIIYPVLSDNVEKDNIDAIKALIGLEQQLINLQEYNKDYRYTAWELINKGLLINPEDQQLLELSEKKIRDYINYTLHELPIGVLYGINGASIEECEELIKQTTEYEEVCRKLNINRQELINKCRYYYPAYKNYLTVRKDYNEFSDYIEKWFFVRISG